MILIKVLIRHDRRQFCIVFIVVQESKETSPTVLFRHSDCPTPREIQLALENKEQQLLQLFEGASESEQRSPEPKTVDAKTEEQ